MKLWNHTLYGELYARKCPEIITFIAHWGPSIQEPTGAGSCSTDTPHTPTALIRPLFPSAPGSFGVLLCSQRLRSQQILCIYKIFIRLQRPRIKTKDHKNIHRRLDQKSLQPNILSVMLAIADAEGRAQGEGKPTIKLPRYTLSASSELQVRDFLTQIGYVCVWRQGRIWTSIPSICVLQEKTLDPAGKK